MTSAPDSYWFDEKKEHACQLLVQALRGLPDNGMCETVIGHYDAARILRANNVAARARFFRGSALNETTPGLPFRVSQYPTPQYGWLDRFVRSTLKVGDMHDDMYVVRSFFRRGGPGEDLCSIIVVEGNHHDIVDAAAAVLERQQKSTEDDLLKIHQKEDLIAVARRRMKAREKWIADLKYTRGAKDPAEYLRAACAA